MTGTATPATQYVLLDDSLAADGRTLLFEDPREAIVCTGPDDLDASLARLGDALKAGHHAAGYFSYELGYLLEPRLTPLFPANRDTPLFWIGLFGPPRALAAEETDPWLAARVHGGHARVSNLRLSIDKEAYLAAFRIVQDYIAAGDVYQINLTFKHLFEVAGDPVALYRELRRKQRVAYGGIIATGDAHVLSLSPELFFKLEDRRITSRPMKGTAARGLTPMEDAAISQWLSVDAKSRAENLMIVDLLRNDLGRIAEIGSVNVTDLFTVETYRTVHQMTSGIEARLSAKASLIDVMRRLFPCGSVTGAPKVRAMEIIRELEPEPRGVYTGSIGYMSPDGDACFNVAIRTLMVRGDGRGEMGIGSGLVADSVGEVEYDECLLKGHFLTRAQPMFELIETIRHERGLGFYLLDRHMARLKASAEHFGFGFDETVLRNRLGQAARDLEAPVNMVRLLLDETGHATITAKPIELPAPGTVWRYAVAPDVVNEDDVFFYHKTTRRDFYENALARAQKATGCDEVIFLNRRGEVTEGARTNVFVERNGHLYTPPVASGLLAGTLRQELLGGDGGGVSEAVLTPDDLATATRVYLGNSVRGLVEARPVDLSTGGRANDADAPGSAAVD